MRRGSSRRLTRWPTSFGKTGVIGIGLSPDVFPSGVLNGVDDVLVAGAAAEIAGDAFANFAFGGGWVVLEQRHGRHDHAGRAVAALQAVLFPEAFLQRVQMAVRSEPFNRRDLRPIG